MSTLRNKAAAVEQLSNMADAELAEVLSHVNNSDLLAIAIDVQSGKPIDHYCDGVAAEKVLRYLASATLLREYARRLEVEALHEMTE